MKFILVIILVLIVGGLYLYPYYFDVSNQGPGSNNTVLRIGKNAIFVPDQRPGLFVNANLVSLEKPGYVVIHQNSDRGFGRVIGNSRILPVGESNQVIISLVERVRHGESYSAVLYEDGGDKAFSPEFDFPVKDDGGDIIFMRFNVDNQAQLPQDIKI